ARQPPPVIPIGDGPTRRAYLRTVRRLSRAKASKRKHAHAGRARAPEWREAATLCWPRARTWSRRSWRRLALHEGRCPSRREIALVIASLPGRPSQGAAAGSPPGRPRLRAHARLRFAAPKRERGCAQSSLAGAVRFQLSGSCDIGQSGSTLLPLLRLMFIAANLAQYGSQFDHALVGFPSALV